MKLTTSNVVTGNVSVSYLTIGNTAVVESLNLGNVNFTPSAVVVGNVSITPAGISTPQLVVGGVAYSGGAWGGIVNYQEFTTSGTWNNPYANAAANASLTGNEQVFVMMWGGGGGGQTSGSPNIGGGGGACHIFTEKISNFTNTCLVTIGAGGAAGTAGGNTIFVINATSNAIAYGGGGGGATGGGGGGGLLGVGNTNLASGVGGSPIGGAASTTTAGDSTFGGGGPGADGAATGGASIFGGGGGGSQSRTGLSSVYGGPGGTQAGAVYTSGVAGSGGNNTVASSGIAAGGGTSAGTVSGTRGEVRVWVMGAAGTTLGTPTYTLTANTTTLLENSSVLYTVTTTNVANGTTLYYTLNNSSSAVSSDFTTAVNGAVVISGGTGAFTLSANSDTDSANEAFQIDIRTTNTTGTIVASNGSVSIVPIIQAVYNGFIQIGDDNLTTSTWSSAPISTADTNRRVIVAIYQRQADDALNNTTASAVTIGGISATMLEYRGDDTRGHVDIWGATVPTGTTADIAVTWRYPTGDGKTLAAYSLYGANLTPYSTANNRALGGAATSANVNVVAGGFVIAVAGADSPGGSYSYFTAGVDINSSNSAGYASGSPGWGSKSITATQTNYTVTADSPDTGDLLLAVASFQPG